jgi:(E)-4-hydroxy-3-methylbut-2-enyl-diphosphate synthase
MAKNTRKVYVGDVPIGGGAPVSVQSMTNTKTTDIASTIEQIKDLENAGCQIVRVAIPDTESVRALQTIKKNINIPVVADIHFDYKLALGAIDAGADKIRINPGNIRNKTHVKEIIKKAIRYDIPIRVGVNAGSLDKRIQALHNGVTVEGLVASALEQIDLCRQDGAEALVLSIKSSDVIDTVNACTQVSEKSDVPLHIGLTEAGPILTGSIKSSVAMGILLNQGIGDTLRVSLTGDPVKEVIAGYAILNSLGLVKKGVNLISCPTCSRTTFDIIPIVAHLEKEFSGLEKSLTVAVMGCEVNGPGEAKHADIGVACGKKGAVLFKKSRVIRRIEENEIIPTLVSQVRAFEEDNNKP